MLDDCGCGGRFVRQLRHITFDDLCTCVWEGWWHGHWYFCVFSFVSARSDYRCCVKWLFSLHSDTHNNMFPLLFLQGPSRCLRHEQKGGIFSFAAQRGSIRGGGAGTEAEHQPFLVSLSKSTAGSQLQGDEVIQTCTLTFEREQPLGTIVPGNVTVNQWEEEEPCVCGHVYSCRDMFVTQRNSWIEVESPAEAPSSKQNGQV